MLLQNLLYEKARHLMESDGPEWREVPLNIEQCQCGKRKAMNEILLSD